MAFTAEAIGDVVVVVLGVDELDAGNVAALKRDVAPVLEAHTKVLLDLSGMRFLDSSGLGFFLSCLRKVMAKGGDLKLCGMSEQVRAVFELLRMQRILEIYDTREDALRAFQAGSSGQAPGGQGT